MVLELRTFREARNCDGRADGRARPGHQFLWRQERRAGGRATDFEGQVAGIFCRRRPTGRAANTSEAPTAKQMILVGSRTRLGRLMCGKSPTFRSAPYLVLGYAHVGAQPQLDSLA